MLLKLLDFLRSDAEVVGRLFLCQANVMIGNMRSEALAEWRPPAVKVANDHLEAASLAWRAYSQPTPQDWFDLLRRDLSILPQLGQAVLELPEELPMAGTGLGATETRMLELISEGDACPYDVFPGHRKPNKRRVFGYWEVGSLLDGLAHCPAGVRFQRRWRCRKRRWLLRRLGVFSDRRTGTDQMAIAMDVVHASHRRPVFVGPRSTRGEA